MPFHFSGVNVLRPVSVCVCGMCPAAESEQKKERNEAKRKEKVLDSRCVLRYARHILLARLQAAGH